MMWRTRIGWFGFPECRGGDTKRISLHTNGYEGNDDSGLDYLIDRMYQVAISATGRYVVFSSAADNLVDDDTPANQGGHRDIFLRDRDTDNDGLFDEPGNVTTTRISKGYDGSEANNDSWEVSISYDGRFIAYSSFADNLVTNDLNAARDVFLYDRVNDVTTLISVANVTGNQGQGNSDHPFVSGDGRFVAFRSVAPNLVSGDTNDVADIFIRQLSTGSTTRVSVDSGNIQADAQSYNPTISETGRYVAFGSDATNLVVGDGNTSRDVFVHDRSTGITTRVSVDSAAVEGDADSYTPFISGNGNFIVFTSDLPTWILSQISTALQISTCMT
jgi:Tol biopolymer transport system component